MKNFKHVQIKNNQLNRCFTLHPFRFAHMTISEVEKTYGIKVVDGERL